MLNAPAFQPTFGSGAPGANAPLNQWYFDTTTTPYTLYTYHAGAWHSSGAVAGINATSIQGVPVKNTAPSTGNKLTYITPANDWEPHV